MIERTKSVVTKHRRLLALAKLRQTSRWPNYKSIGDYQAGIYECDFVSRFTMAAGNVDAEVMVLLQDWSSDDELRQGLDEETLRLGYSPTQPTTRNLERLLKTTFDLSLSDVYATNLFPFVKPGKVSGRIPVRDLTRAAREFALPQIEIVNPRHVICLGLDTFDALRRACDLTPAGHLVLAIGSPFTVGNTRVWCQAHTGAFGRMNRNKGGVDRVSQDWLRMKEDWRTEH